MLGQYQQRVGIYTAGQGGSGFDPNIPILPGMLPDAYTSMAIGKWHLGLDNDYPELKWHAMSRGFDEAYKFMGRGSHDYFESKGVNGDDYAPIYRNKKRIPRDEYEGYLTTRLTEEAVAFIDRQKRSPFFLYLAYNAVHTPAQAPEADIEYYRKKFPNLSERRTILMAMLDHLDKGVGAVVNKLKEEAIWDNTLLFFLTDNGGAAAMEADNGSLRDYNEWAVRKGDWKLHSRKGKVSLFNLSNDESETTDLSKRNAEIVQELSALYEAWLADMVRSEKSLGR